MTHEDAFHAFALALWYLSIAATPALHPSDVADAALWFGRAFE